VTISTFLTQQVGCNGEGRLKAERKEDWLLTIWTTENKHETKRTDTRQIVVCNLYWRCGLTSKTWEQSMQELTEMQQS